MSGHQAPHSHPGGGDQPKPGHHQVSASHILELQNTKYLEKSRKNLPHLMKLGNGSGARSFVGKVFSLTMKDRIVYFIFFCNEAH